MSWAKFDDRYDDGSKIRRAWHAHPRAVGLHAMSITYCARNETDGRLDDLWLVEKLPVKRERDQVIAVLVDAGLFDRVDGGFEVHDYLDYNDTRATLVERRRKDAERKGRRPPPGSGPSVPPESEGSPNGVPADSARSPGASRGGGSAGALPRPDPTQTKDPTLTPPRRGGRKRDRQREEEGHRALAARLYPGQANAVFAVRGAIGQGSSTDTEIRQWVAKWRPDLNDSTEGAA